MTEMFILISVLAGFGLLCFIMIVANMAGWLD